MRRRNPFDKIEELDGEDEDTADQLRMLVAQEEELCFQLIC
jgi:type IV secretory pathway TraG/TraD family ATPase VirD4